LILWKYSSRRI